MTAPLASSRAPARRRAPIRPATPRRQDRRREITRTKLLDATRALSLERDISTITIAEIAARADVGFGSFYNHFASKEAILEATTSREVQALHLAIDAVVARESDCALRLACAVRHFVRHALHDPMWRWFVDHADYAWVAVRVVFGPSLERDLVLGRKLGRFRFEDREAAAEFVVGGTLAVVGAVIQGRLAESRAEGAALLVMRALGVDEGDLPALLRHRLAPLRKGRRAPAPAASATQTGG